MIEGGIMFVVDEDGNLLVLAEPPQGVLWRGLPAGRRVTRFVTSGSPRVCVALLEPDPRVKGDANLVAVDERGTELWTADPPDSAGGDRFVAVALEGERVVAHAWSGYRITLDVRTGAAAERKFTK
jgi:hypothetical protein